MCMYILTEGMSYPNPRVAHEDIKCFKIVSINEEGNLHSAARKFPYQMGKVYTEKGDFSKICLLGHYYHLVEGGGFHSFVELDDAYLSYDGYRDTYGEKMIVVRCHIPKGSLYYVGKTLGGEPNYVSQSIVLDEIMYPISLDDENDLTGDDIDKIMNGN